MSIFDHEDPTERESDLMVERDRLRAQVEELEAKNARQVEFIRMLEDAVGEDLSVQMAVEGINLLKAQSAQMREALDHCFRTLMFLREDIDLDTLEEPDCERLLRAVAGAYHTSKQVLDSTNCGKAMLDKVARLEAVVEKCRVALEWAVNDAHVTGNFNCLAGALRAIKQLEDAK